jgi:Flp pilus assembly protein TadG
MVETLVAFPLLLLIAATAVQLALVAMAGLLVRHAATLAARAAAVTGGSVAEARRAAAAACAFVDPQPEVIFPRFGGHLENPAMVRAEVFDGQATAAV